MAAKTPVRFLAALLVVPVLLFSYGYVNGAANLEAQQRALNMIADFADRFCNKIPLTGEGNQVELTGEGKAELNELIKKIVDLKIEGAAKYLGGEYKGVLQQDLIEALTVNATCREKIWDDLKKLVPQASQAEPEPSPQQPVQPKRPNSNNEILKAAKQKGLQAQERPEGLVINFPWIIARRADGMTVLASETERNLRRTAGILANEARERRIRVAVQSYGISKMFPAQQAQAVANELAKLGVEPERMTVEGIPTDDPGVRHIIVVIEDD